MYIFSFELTSVDVLIYTIINISGLKFKYGFLVC